MSTFKSHHEEAEIKPEIIEITQDEDQTQQQIQKIIQNQSNPLKIQSEPEASTSEPQENESESLLVKKPGKRKLRNEQVLPIETDRLIQLVRCMRCLYDPQHPRHRDTQVRRDLWDIIGKAMDLPGNACEENWQTLIDKFTKSKNKKRDFKKLKWFLSYISTNEAELEDSVTDSQKKNSNSSGKITFLHAIGCECNTAPLAHPMQKFLAEIATTLKKLSPQQQNLAKLEIFEIVHKFGLMKSTELPVTGMKTEIDSDD